MREYSSADLIARGQGHSMSLTNPTYDNLAQTAHTLAGYAIALTAARFGTVPLLVIAGLFVA